MEYKNSLIINIQNQIEEIFNIFQIDIKDYFKTTGPYGNYVTKIKGLFNTGNTRFTFIRKGRGFLFDYKSYRFVLCGG